MLRYNPISPDFLHKNSSKDVLLMNPRTVLPSKISLSRSSEAGAESSGSLIELYQCDPKDKRIWRFAIPEKTTNEMTFSALSGGEIHVRGIPYQIIEKMNADQDERGMTRRHEHINADSVSEFIKKNKIKRQSTSFTFVNDANHYFFYNKPHEHVPGIMLIEAARQAIYYQLYTYTKHILGKVTVSLSELNTKFYVYAELMYPIEVVVDDLTEGDSLFPKIVNYSISFYQRGALVAKIDSVVPVIDLERFKMARNVYLLSNGEMFRPIKSAPIIAILTDNDMKQCLVEIQKIGKGLCLTNEPASLGGERVTLTILYNGSLCFSASASYSHGIGDSVVWNFTSSEYRDLEILKEIIKRGFILCEPYKNA